MSLRREMSDPVKCETVMLLRERPYWYVHELVEHVRGSGEAEDAVGVGGDATQYMQDELSDLIQAGVVKRRRVDGPAQVGPGPRFQEALDLL